MPTFPDVFPDSHQKTQLSKTVISEGQSQGQRDHACLLSVHGCTYTICLSLSNCKYRFAILYVAAGIQFNLSRDYVAVKCYTPDAFIIQRLHVHDDVNLNVTDAEAEIVSDRNNNGMCY